MTYSAAEISTHQSVYVLTGGIKHVKIGISHHVEKRIKELQTGCPFEIRLAKAFRTPHARKIEGMAHNVLAKYRKAGEWFNVPNNVACAVVRNLVGSMPRSSHVEPRPLKSIVFCGNCSHHAELGMSPKITTTFRCSKCRRRDHVHVVDF